MSEELDRWKGDASKSGVRRSELHRYPLAAAYLYWPERWSQWALYKARDMEGINDHTVEEVITILDGIERGANADARCDSRR